MISRGPLILMYHAIGLPGERASRYVVPLPRFRRQLGLLSLLRYAVVPLEEVVQHADQRSRAVVLTFDDGYEDNRLAFVELERRRLPATLFAVSGPERNEWEHEPPLAGRRLIRAERLEELGSLVAIGAHTRTHPALTALPDEAVREEVAGSRRDLEEVVGQPVTAFAYPYGAHDERVRALVEEAGFRAACTVAHGWNGPGTPPLELRRLEIQGSFSLARFLLTLWLGDTRIGERLRGRFRRSGPQSGVA